MKKPNICRYFGGIIRLVPIENVYRKGTRNFGFGDERKRYLGSRGEKLYQCQNCNARVGCHKGTTRPLGNVANETLRLKRIETHHVFDTFWKSRHMTRTQAYKWLSQQMRLPAKKAHIRGFEMDQCQQVIDMCGNQEAAHGG